MTTDKEPGFTEEGRVRERGREGGRERERGTGG
jgi:hypothetical protein